MGLSVHGQGVKTGVLGGQVLGTMVIFGKLYPPVRDREELNATGRNLRLILFLSHFSSWSFFRLHCSC